MARGKKDSRVVGLDIGTTKICALVGERKENGSIDICGIGTSPSNGLRKGVVVNIESTVKSIKKAIQEAQLMADYNISSVYAGIAGGHIRGINSHGIVAVKEGEVKSGDIDRVIDAARAVAIPIDREIIHVLPQEYIIDGQDGIREPLGMAGVRLECKVHIVTGAVTSAQNIVKCAQRCDISVSDIVLEQLASSYAVLSEDEKELGVALVDIGGGTTDIAIFFNGSIQHTSVIAVGGQHFTNDIAIGLRTPQESAELIKKRYGTASMKSEYLDEMIEVPSIGNRPDRMLKRQILAEILEPRVRETFEIIAREIERVRLTELLASGIVITGGSSLLPGMIEIAEEVIGLPVRLGVPRGVGGLMDVVKSPIYATGVGLVLYGAKHCDHRHFKVRDDNIYTKVRRRMSAWLNDII
ncbi:MAG: cell division protein FtsA [Myxococcales bacterium]|nr:cell division protein FtsA [Myxococcales bacterium]USN51303.1 MAG: cell division protein FtsA [Myxococcales bacterium]